MLRARKLDTETRTQIVRKKHAEKAGEKVRKIEVRELKRERRGM